MAGVAKVTEVVYLAAEHAECCATVARAGGQAGKEGVEEV